MQNQIETMLTMQDAMNSKVTTDWRVQNYEWYRAIWIECAELLDHYGWKWWKKQSPDIEQVILELIDIWHFGLSIKLMEGEAKEQGVASIAKAITEEMNLSAEIGALPEDLEQFSMITLQTKGFDIPLFCKLLSDVGLSFDQLYSSYVGKNVLNFFRQDHGYKEGTYIKTWNGKEDNEHLVEVQSDLDPKSEDYQQAVYDGLTSRYPS